MKNDDILKEALRFDALDFAKRVTGERVDERGQAFSLGFVLMQQNAAVKESLLTERGDTTFTNMLDRYISIVEAYGFQLVLEDSFTGRDDRAERFFIFAHPDGLLLAFDTFETDHVNGGKVYYNWKPSSREAMFQFTSSGSMARLHDVWVGDHDAREALIFKMDQLRANGSFVKPWVERPFLWLLHYMDPKVNKYDYREINEERISRLPAWVREFIGEDRG